MLENLFKLKAHGVTARGEFLAGLTTFMTMAYILAVNPQILGAAGLSAGGVLIATAIASFIGCVLMAVFANLPFALAPGMGLNAYFTYTVVLTMGISPALALFAVFVEGLIFIVLSLTNVREAIFNAIPLPLKHAVGAGIGLFIAFIGLQNAKIVVDHPATLVGILNFRDKFHTQGITAILCIVGVFIIAVLSHRKVRGAIFFGIIGTWVLGMICQAVGLYVPNPEESFFSLYPSFSGPDFQGFFQNFGLAFKLDFAGLDFVKFITVILAFLFVDIFDTLGTLIGVANRANLLNEKGELPGIKGALAADAVATTAGAVLGTSTVTTYIESSAGVAEGGRTGLTALTTGFFFLIAIVFSPIFIAIPAFATASALIYVGFLMMSAILKVNFEDISESLPAFICAIAMPLFYSISEGIALGIISYVIINLFAGKAKKVSLLMYLLCILFVAKYIFL